MTAKLWFALIFFAVGLIFLLRYDHRFRIASDLKETGQLNVDWPQQSLWRIGGIAMAAALIMFFWEIDFFGLTAH